MEFFFFYIYQFLLLPPPFNVNLKYFDDSQLWNDWLGERGRCFSKTILQKIVDTHGSFEFFVFISLMSCTVKTQQLKTELFFIHTWPTAWLKRLHPDPRQKTIIFKDDPITVLQVKNKTNEREIMGGHHHHVLTYFYTLCVHNEQLPYLPK